MQSLAYGAVTAVLGLVLVVLLAIRRIRPTMAGMPDADGLDGLGRGRGLAAVRRAGRSLSCSTRAGRSGGSPSTGSSRRSFVLNICGPLDRGALCAVRANGIELMTLGPTERLCRRRTRSRCGRIWSGRSRAPPGGAPTPQLTDLELSA